MKFSLLFLTLLASSWTYAESVSTTFPPFRGELKLEREELKIVKLELVARNQFCNFWGTSCAGGPSDDKIATIAFKLDPRTKLVSFTQPSKIKLSSFKIGNRFSSCNLNLVVRAVDGAGAAYEGSERLIWENSKEVCESESELRSALASIFQVPLALELFKRY